MIFFLIRREIICLHVIHHDSEHERIGSSTADPPPPEKSITTKHSSLSRSTQHVRRNSLLKYPPPPPSNGTRCKSEIFHPHNFNVITPSKGGFGRFEIVNLLEGSLEEHKKNAIECCIVDNSAHFLKNILYNKLDSVCVLVDFSMGS